MPDPGAGVQNDVAAELRAQAAAAAQTELKRRKRRDLAISSSVVLGRLTQSNAYDKLLGHYPWVDFQERIARYLDTPAAAIGMPIKLVAVSRGHLKTEVGCHCLARYALANPERRCAIIGAAADRAEANLECVRGILTCEGVQGIFQDVVYPAHSTWGANAYTQDSILLRREGVYRERTIEAFGRNKRFAGRHYNGVIWIDDIVTEQDDFENNPKIAEDCLHLLEHIIEFVADPGAEIWMTFTRYSPADPYAALVDPDGPHRSSIVQPPIILDCYERAAPDPVDPASGLHPVGEIIGPLYPFRHSIKKEDEVADVVFRGKLYPQVRRRSLEEMEARMDPREWYSQMLNSPRVGECMGFSPQQFESVIEWHGNDIKQWFRSAPECALSPFGFTRDMGEDLITHIFGDPSFRDGRGNDFAVLWAVAQTRNNHAIVLDGFRGRLGYQGDIQYAKKALWMKQVYGANLLAIEKHAKESIETVFQLIAREQGLRISLHPLPNNSHIAKKERIATLIPWFTEGRVHFTKNVDECRRAVQAEAKLFPACCGGGRGMHDDSLDALANMTQVFKPRAVDLDRTALHMHGWRARLPRRIGQYLPSVRRAYQARAARGAALTVGGLHGW